MSTTAMQSQNATTTWQIDPAHTEVGFEVKHMMFAKVRGRFDAVEGTVVLVPESDFGSSSVHVVMDAASIHTGQAQRDEHLRSPDFLDAERFPNLRFKSLAVRRNADGSIALTGELTIRDVTKSVDLVVAESGRAIDPWGQERVGFSASATIDRREFGLTWNQALETGGILVGNDVRITIEAQAVLQDA